MAKLRIFIITTISLLILGTTPFTIARRNREPAQVFSATVNRDCAPWDGSAFTVLVRYDATTTITISIWKSPELKFPVTFSFPDETDRVGIVYILPELDPLEELTGKVWFQRAEQGISLAGGFRLTSVQGNVYEGGFVAEWGSQITYCG